jgi:hypothetical protein
MTMNKANQTTFLLLVLSIVVFSWLQNDETAERDKDDESVNAAKYIYHHEQRIKDQLKDRDSAEFRGVYVSKASGHPVVCGYVNAKNSFGGYSGFQRFISAGTIQVLASNMTQEEMDKTWKLLCADQAKN